MGVDPVSIAFLVASTAIGVATTTKQAAAAKRSSRAQERSNQIKENREKFNQTQEIRRKVRLRRIRVAQLTQQSEGGGTDGSSGEFGAVSSAASQTNSAVANAFGQNKAVEGINKSNKAAASAQLDAQLIGAKGELFQDVLGGFNSLFGE